jgi:membrane-associated phospholipid phosphatase
MIFPEWLEHADRALMLLIHNDWSTPFLDRVLPVIRNRDTWIPFYILLAVYMFYKFRLRGVYMVLIIGASAGLTDLVSSSVVKPLVGRERPCHEPELEGEVNAMVYCGMSKSFTSSHAANHTALALSISLLLLKGRKWLQGLLFLWALLIGYAQVYVGVHYPLDILGGIAVGLLAAAFVYFLALKIGYSVNH